MSVPFGLIAGTLVATPTGPRAIETLHPGDRVWAWDLSRRVAIEAPVVALHAERVDHLNEIVGSVSRLRGCAPGTGIFDAFEEMFRAAASVSSLSEVLVWQEGVAISDPVDEVPEHNRPDTGIHHLTLGEDQTCFFADGLLVRHRTES
jgi:hypothetical protein